jgi:pyridoxal phosphate enzyme (YggS family)
VNPGALAARLATVRARLDAAARRAGRDPAEITLIGVTKRMPATQVAEALRAGLSDVGENYVQEAREKEIAVRALLETSTARWHMIGRLQRNKAKVAAQIFDVVHSVDRPELARELDRHAATLGRRLAIFLQVSLCDEPQKGGAPPEAVPALVAACAACTALDVRGLMTIPRDVDHAEATRPVFARLRALRDTLHLAEGGENLHALSMGMSSDFEIAVEEGATHVRVGTAIFGARPDDASPAGSNDPTVPTS